MTYRLVRGARWAFLGMFTVFAVVAVMLVITAFRGDGPPPWFALLWLAALGWNAYWWLVRTVVEIEVDGPALRWITPLRRGSAPVADVVRIRASRMSRQLALIELREGRPLLVPVRYGFASLERAIGAGSPGVTVEER